MRSAENGPSPADGGRWDQLLPEDVETVSACTPDAYGRLIGKRLSRNEFLSAVRTGIATPNFHLVTDARNNVLDGLSVTGGHTGFPNGYLLPSPSHVIAPPWSPSTRIALCDVVDSKLQPVVQAPRAILERQVHRLAEHGLHAQVATELEFFLFRDSFRGAYDKEYSGLTPFFHRHGDHDVLVTEILDEFLGDVRRAMTAMGAEPLAVLGEGGVGQAEMNFPHGDPAAVADRHVLFKHTVRTLAQRRGHSVTFMAKYDPTQAGSSCHLHVSLWDDEGRPVEGGGSNSLAEPTRHFLAGILEYTPEFQLMHTPVRNSYSRLDPGNWAPTTRTWGFDNRSALVRVLGEDTSRRLEFRLPGADANPYMSIAGLLAAGIAGLEDKPTLPDPIVGNACARPDSSAVHLTLPDAVAAFSDSERAADALGADVHQHLAQRAAAEILAHALAVTDWDVQRGFESA